MSSPFSQTTRSLDADTVRGALFAWVPAVVVLAAWGAWFTGGRLTETAVSQQARIAPAEVPGAGLRIVADFPAAAAIGRVQPGQTAWLRVDGGRADVAAQVLRVDGQVREGRVQVELAPAADSLVSLHPGLAGVAEVAVGQATPAALLARSLGWPAAAAITR